MNEISMQKEEDFQTVTSEPDYKLFSPGQIIVATLFGFVIAGQVLLALNYAKLKEAKRANRKLLVVLASLLVMAIFPPLNLLFSIYFLISFYPEFKRQQGNKYAEHIALGGERCSNWDVAALCVLSYIIFFLSVIFLSMISRFLPF